jgi:hypothetical protein
MSDKCVELQLLHNEQTQLVESLTNKSGSLQKKRLAQEAVALRKERDRMIHNAKAAMWKLQEVSARISITCGDFMARIVCISHIFCVTAATRRQQASSKAGRGIEATGNFSRGGISEPTRITSFHRPRISRIRKSATRAPCCVADYCRFANGASC